MTDDEPENPETTPPPAIPNPSATITLTAEEFFALYWLVNDCCELHLPAAEKIHNALYGGKKRLVRVLMQLRAEVNKEQALRHNRKHRNEH